MNSNPFPIGIRRNPLVHSVFVRGFEEQGNLPPPPTENFRITDATEIRATDSGDKRITD